MTLHIRDAETDALARTSRRPAMAVRDEIGRFPERAGVKVRAILIETARLAIQAFARYGKFSSHPVRLNGGKCFAYVMAQQHHVPLRFKGDDSGFGDLA